MAKPTPSEARERKGELIKLGKDVATMTESPGWKYLAGKLDELESSARNEILSATSWDDFLSKKARLDGLGTLNREVAKTISRGRNQERSLTS